MQTFIPKFLKILQIEMEDLESDIEYLIERLKQRSEKQEITDYVFMQNLAVLKNQICGISSFMKIVDSIDPNDYKDIESFLCDVKARFTARIDEYGLGSGIYTLIQRKIDKVYMYIHQA
ncbi:MAG: hypothetical protein JXJ04_27135 [Spirochaetales bacterium]|nr:hypothetical protein [Spirochaetales bacterium]